MPDETIPPPEQPAEPVPPEVTAAVEEVLGTPAEALPVDEVIQKVVEEAERPVLTRVGYQGWTETLDAKTGDVISRVPPEGQ